jgi:hypothetical protein
MHAGKVKRANADMLLKKFVHIWKCHSEAFWEINNASEKNKIN